MTSRAAPGRKGALQARPIGVGSFLFVLFVMCVLVWFVIICCVFVLLYYFHLCSCLVHSCVFFFAFLVLPGSARASLASLDRD